MNQPDNQTAKGSWWSVTINNPTDDDRVLLKTLPSFVKKVVVQDEIGENGTLHLQCAINTQQVRFSAMKKWLPRGHIEVARNVEALKAYVRKSETAVPGTQDEITNTAGNGYSMKDLLLMVARTADNDTALWRELKAYREDICDGKNPKKKSYKQILTEIYEEAINEICYNNPELIILFVRPDYLRGWLLFYPTLSRIVQEEATGESEIIQPDSQTPDEPPSPPGVLLIYDESTLPQGISPPK